VTDLKGKRIAESAIGTDPDFALRLALPRYNLAYSDIQVVQLPDGGDPARLALGETMARAWIAFARTGNPGWKPYDTTTRPTMVFDLESRVENDPFGAERRAWED